MTITFVQAPAGISANATTSASLAFGSNVTAGNLVVVVAPKFSPSNDAWQAGDCTKSAGTATIGTIAFDVSISNQQASDGVYADMAIWSAIVTGSGSLTMQVSGAASNSYILLSVAEFSGAWDSSRLETSNTNNADPGTTTTNCDSGSVTSAGAALMLAGIQLNVVSGGGTLTEDGSFTSLFTNTTTTDDNGGAQYRIVSTGTTDAANWTLSGDTLAAWAAAIAVYKEVVGVNYTLTASGASFALTGSPMSIGTAQSSFATITSATDSAGATSYTTGSFTSVEGRYYIVNVAHATGVVSVTSVTSTSGITFANLGTNASGPRFVTVWGGFCQAGSSGTITINLSSSSGTNSYTVEEVAGLWPAQPVQSANAGAQTVSLASFASASNPTYLAARSAAAMTIESGWTQLNNIGSTAALLTGYLLSNDTSPSFTGTSSSPGIVGIELAASQAALLRGYSLTADVGSFALTGQAAAFAVGHTVTAGSGSFSLAGQDAGFSVGHTLSAGSGSFALTGQDAGFVQALNLTIEAGSFSLAGQDAAFSVGHALVVESTAFALTGQDASFSVGHTLSIEPGSFVLTGQDAGFGQSLNLTADSGAFTLTGNDAGLTQAPILGAASGSFVLTGTDAAFSVGHTLSVGSGSFAFTGSDTGLTIGHNLSAETGAFTLTGQSIGFIQALSLGAGSGSYVLTGMDAVLSTGPILTAGSGSFTLAGQDVAFVVSRALAAAHGDFILSGQPASLSVGHTLAAGGGSYALTGQDADLIYVASAPTLIAGAGAFAFTGYSASFIHHSNISGLEVPQFIFESLRGLVSDRVYPSVFPQGDALPVWPAIRYTLISTVAPQSLCGSNTEGDADDIRVQIDAVATTYAGMRNLKRDIVATLQDTDPPSTREGGFEVYDAETKTHRATMDYTFALSAG